MQITHGSNPHHPSCELPAQLVQCKHNRYMDCSESLSCTCICQGAQQVPHEQLQPLPSSLHNCDMRWPGPQTHCSKETHCSIVCAASLFAFHICLLRSCLRSVCLRIIGVVTRGDGITRRDSQYGARAEKQKLVAGLVGVKHVSCLNNDARVHTGWPGLPGQLQVCNLYYGWSRLGCRKRSFDHSDTVVTRFFLFAHTARLTCTFGDQLRMSTPDQQPETRVPVDRVTVVQQVCMVIRLQSLCRVVNPPSRSRK